MKTLITGGYGFIGSHVAEKFFKEGHEISIIDNLSTGRAENVKVRHKFYKLNVEDKECEKVFKDSQFDIVIHLAAQADVTTSLADPYLDTKVNVLGLVNILQLSSKYNVKKLILASSAAVYGDNPNIPLKETFEPNPLSPYGLSKYIGELYCKKWSQIYNLDTLCFRFSNVYGPRQNTKGEGGVVAIFSEKILKGEDLLVYGDGTQTRDFIYVEDISHAIYKASISSLRGVYNLSTGEENSVNDLIEILKKLHPIESVIYKPSRAGDIKNSCLDNSNIRNSLDWRPSTLFQKGLENTFKWYSSVLTSH